MSSYTSFYIKRYGVYIPIASYGRSSIISRFFNAPYNRCEPLLRNVIEDVEQSLNNYKIKMLESSKECKQKMEFLHNLNNSLDEKMSAYYEINNELVAIKEEIKEVEYALNFTYLLENIISESYHDGMNEEDCLYWGEDCGDPMVLEYDQFGRGIKRYKVEVSEEEVDYQTSEK